MSPRGLTSLHLLRALLRQVSYLPDATARNYFRSYIVDRFKDYNPTRDARDNIGVHSPDGLPRGVERQLTSVVDVRVPLMQRQGRKALSLLRRANNGELKCLEKILMFTYGRLGKRKYTLLSDLLEADPLVEGDRLLPAPDIKGPAPLQKLYYSDARFLQYFEAPQASGDTDYTISISDRYSRMRAVIRSQCEKSRNLNGVIKRPFLKTPIHNVWQRSMPIRRARNNVKRWYAETMTKLLPPLPAEEWDNINAIIRREKHVGFAKQRVPIVELPTQSPQVDLPETILQGLAMDKPSKADRYIGARRSSPYSVQKMRRLYTKILSLSCKLEYNQTLKKWEAIWGEPAKEVDSRSYNAPTDASLFAGVNSAGRVLTVRKSNST